MKKPRNIVGPNLRKLRNERGYSQPQLAAKCQRIGWDVSRDIIAKIEDQRRWVADFELAGLAAVLEVSIEEIFPSQSIALKRLKNSG